MLEFSSRHAFQAATPCLSNATCLSFAIGASGGALLIGEGPPVGDPSFCVMAVNMGKRGNSKNGSDFSGYR
jgi:hypothetical protein